MSVTPASHQFRLRNRRNASPLLVIPEASNAFARRMNPEAADAAPATARSPTALHLR